MPNRHKTHATGHKTRLARRTFYDSFSEERDFIKEELIAELSACFLNAHAGILEAEIESSADYLKFYLKAADEHPYELLREAAEEANKVTGFILGLPIV